MFIFFILRSLKASRNDHTSPHDGPIKNFCYKTLIFKHNWKWNRTNSKLEPKKLSLLCTFKFSVMNLLLQHESAWCYCFHQLIRQRFLGEFLGSFFAGTEDWTEKRRVFLRSEPWGCGASETGPVSRWALKMLKSKEEFSMTHRITHLDCLFIWIRNILNSAQDKRFLSSTGVNVWHEQELGQPS